MPTQAVQTEEENLIILDDIVEENTSPEIQIDEPVSSEEIIDFGSSESDKENNDMSIDLLGDNTIDTDSSIVPDTDSSIVSDNDSSLDLGSFDMDSENTTVSDLTEDKKEDEIISSEESLSDLGSDLGASIDELGGNGFQDNSQAEDNSSDLNSILNGTIVQLQSRADIISQNKEIEKDNIKDFKSQISILEDNVASSEGIVSTLNKEALKIKTNIKSLERMKMKDEVEETKKQTSAKVHNSKRTR